MRFFGKDEPELSLKQKFEAKITRGEDAEHKKANDQLEKIADHLLKDIEKAINKGSSFLTVDLWCSEKLSYDNIRTCPQYKRIHEMCAAPDVDMSVSLNSSERTHKSLKDRWEDIKAAYSWSSHSDGTLTITFDRPYKSSPDAHLFPAPQPAPVPEPAAPPVTAAEIKVEAKPANKTGDKPKRIQL